jgi:polyisoprenoid-binding protein YceI
MRSRWVTWSAFLLVGAVPAVALATLVDAGDVDVRFLATGPAGMKINGTGSDLKANEADGQLTIKVPVTHLKTGIGLRDKHLKKYLETDKHPNAQLSVARSSLKLPEDNQDTQAKGSGSFTLHGVTKTLPFSYKAKRTGSDYHVQALATVDIRDHGIEVPCYLGVCVDPLVKLKVKFKLRDQ